MNDFQQNEKEDSDHVVLRRLLQEAEPIVMPMFPDQIKKWIAESALAKNISAILARHPEYYDEVRAVDGGILSDLRP